MSDFKDGVQAFPLAIAVSDLGDVYTGQPGMSLRDWFAGQAEMPRDGISLVWAEAVMGEKAPDWLLDNALDCVRWWSAAEAKARYIAADAMLAERSKDRSPP